VKERRSKINGSFVDEIGHVYPHTNPATIKIDKDKISGWVAKGAQITPAVKKLLKKK
jgi:ribosomal protein S16